MSLGNGQLRRITGQGESLTDLAAVSEVATLSEIIVIYLDAVVYFCVPRRAFPTAEAEKEFVASLRGTNHFHGSELSGRSARPTNRMTP
jgi:hypothetical protein